MPPTIIVAAFGTSPAALAAYARIDGALRQRYADCDIRWCYSGRGRKNAIDPASHPPPTKVLAELAETGVKEAVVQYLLLLPGREFHDLQAIFHASPIACRPSLPLLCSPEDYQILGDLLEPTIAARPDQAILLLGHGTAHPIWTAYLSLQTLLRRRFGPRVFVGVIEHFPDSRGLPEEIAAAGYAEVCLIPLLLITATHFHRDMVGEQADSWSNRLSRCGLGVEVIDHGLAEFPGSEAWVAGHLGQALGRDQP